MQQPSVLSRIDQRLVLLVNFIFCAKVDMHNKENMAIKMILFTSLSIKDPKDMEI